MLLCPSTTKNLKIIKIKRVQTLVDVDDGETLFSPEWVSTRCIHMHRPNHNKQPFHSVRGLRATPSISHQLLQAPAASWAASREYSGSFITWCRHLGNQMNGNSPCPQRVFSATYSEKCWKLWAFQVNVCVSVTKAKCMPGKPCNSGHQKLLFLWSMRLQLVNMEKT